MTRTNRGKFGMGLLATALLAGGLCLGMTTASATTISASVGGVPTGADCYENFESLPLGGTGGMTTGCGVVVSFEPDAQAVQGFISGQYARPYLSNGNGALFGNPVDGPDATTYLAAGSTGAHPSAAVTLTFPGQEHYLGLLWGSVDDYNTLTFYQNGTSVGSFTGTDIGNAAGLGNCIGGDQGEIGTCYVNINLSDWFDSVVATSSDYTFEFDNVAFSTHQINVPEPGAAGIFLLGLLFLGAGYWYRRRRLA